jgi:Ca2+-binding RTX toxin-like protein
LNASINPFARAENRLGGGAGNDVLTGTVADGTFGRSVLDGGSGNDRLTAVGGTDNVLKGGAGRDLLAGGTGNDDLAGGQAADTFRFDLSQDQGTDRIIGFERNLDRFSFAGLSDAGAPGLVDDLDGLSTFSETGADLVVDLASGTRIVFAGLASTHVQSWSDLVLAPSSDLILL